MGKSKKGKKKEGKIIDGLLPSEMSKAQLLGHIVRLQGEMDKEREERNYYMLEREKIFQLWNLVLEQIQLEKEKAALFASNMQDVERNKEAEDALYSQKLRFLKQEHTRKLGQVRLHHLSQMKHIQDDAWALQMVMREALMGKKKEIRQAQMAFYQILRGLYWKHAKDVSDLRKEFAREIRRLETNFDRRLFEMNDKKEEEQERQIAILASNKEEQVHKLIESHRYQTQELQKFFRDLIRHNLALIYGMKDAAKKQKTYELRARKDYEGFKDKYEKYIGSAVKWKKDMEEWAIETADDNLETLLLELQSGNEEAKHLRHNQRMLECSNETMKQRILIAEKERENLRQEFRRSTIDLQRRTAMSRMVTQIRHKAALREADFYESLADNVEKDRADETDYFMSLMSSRDHDFRDIKMEITDYATEHKNVEVSYVDSFIRNEINVADIGFPIKKTGARARRVEEDVFLTTDTTGSTERERESRIMSKKRSQTGGLKLNKSKSTASAQGLRLNKSSSSRVINNPQQRSGQA